MISRHSTQLKQACPTGFNCFKDPAVGFISIEQNDVVKVLTVVSVVGVPPVLIVGIYGMNFKFMPELSWRLRLSLCTRAHYFIDRSAAPLV